MKKTMYDLWKEDIENFRTFCNENKLQADQIMNYPKSCGEKNIWFLLAEHPEKGHLGLADDTPMKIVLEGNLVGEKIIYSVPQ